MGFDPLAKVVKHGGIVLGSGESWRAAVAVMPKAWIARATTGAADGLVDVASGRRRVDQRREREAENSGDYVTAGIEIGVHGAFLATTDRRLVLFKNSWKGKPAGVLGAWPLSGLHVETSHHRVGLNRAVALYLYLPDNTAVACDVVCTGPIGKYVEQLLGSLPLAEAA